MNKDVKNTSSKKLIIICIMCAVLMFCFIYYGINNTKKTYSLTYTYYDCGTTGKLVGEKQCCTTGNLVSGVCCPAGKSYATGGKCYNTSNMIGAVDPVSLVAATPKTNNYATCQDIKNSTECTYVGCSWSTSQGGFCKTNSTIGNDGNCSGADCTSSSNKCSERSDLGVNCGAATYYTTSPSNTSCISSGTEYKYTMTTTTDTCTGNTAGTTYNIYKYTIDKTSDPLSYSCFACNVTGGVKYTWALSADGCTKQSDITTYSACTNKNTYTTLTANFYVGSSKKESRTCKYTVGSSSCSVSAPTNTCGWGEKGCTQGYTTLTLTKNSDFYACSGCNLGTEACWLCGGDDVDDVMYQWSNEDKTIYGCSKRDVIESECKNSTTAGLACFACTSGDDTSYIWGDGTGSTSCRRKSDFGTKEKCLANNNSGGSSGSGDSDSPSIPSNPSSTPSGSSNVDTNPKTGSIAIFVVWLIAIGTMVYSVMYFRELRKEN